MSRTILISQISESHDAGINMSNPTPSSHGPGGSQPINPYEASRFAGRDDGTLVPNESAVTRDFRARFDWFDRQQFLHSVPATRLSAIVGGMVSLKTTYDAGNSVWFAFSRDAGVLGSGFYLAMSVLTTLALGQAALTLLALLLSWRYADLLQAVVGGKTTSCNQWSFLHYRLEWLSAAWWILTGSIVVGHWLLGRALTVGLGV
jgi:hypothetical protein